ncbi:hypothetical protein R1flu_028553 [Riccia fluitans]|uniref:Uncharacterized protein n=1 Tax=Riccia fluitans TaxID=41844 RepID=A0ABD1XM09_9MARC
MSTGGSVDVENYAVEENRDGGISIWCKIHHGFVKIFVAVNALLHFCVTVVQRFFMIVAWFISGCIFLTVTFSIVVIIVTYTTPFPTKSDRQWRLWGIRILVVQVMAAVVTIPTALLTYRVKACEHSRLLDFAADCVKNTNSEQISQFLRMVTVWALCFLGGLATGGFLSGCAMIILCVVAMVLSHNPLLFFVLVLFCASMAQLQQTVT